VLVLSFCFSPHHHHMHDAVQYNILVPQIRQSRPGRPHIIRLFLRPAQHHFEGERPNRQVSSLRNSPSRCSVIFAIIGRGVIHEASDHAMATVNLPLTLSCDQGLNSWTNFRFASANSECTVATHRGSWVTVLAC
jgi:hypothetical protein